MADVKFLLDETDELAPSEDSSLRDWFAGQVVRGVMGNSDPDMHVSTMSAADFADMAYEVADAMLERKTRGPRSLSLVPQEMLDE